MKGLLLIAVLYIAMSLSACGSLTTPQSGGEKAPQEKATGGKDAANNSIKEGKPPGAKLDVCSLTTREEVEAALGRTVMEPTRADELVSRKAGTVTSSCMFGSNEGFIRLSVRQQDPASSTMWNAARAYGDLKELVKGSDGQPSGRSEEVTGLGADAFAETKAETANFETTELRILGKRTLLTIRVTGPASTPTLEAAKMIAAKAASRLERYESDAIVPAPKTPSTAPESTAKLDGDERVKAPEGVQIERKSAKKVERPRAQMATKATTPTVSKNNSRRTDGSSPKKNKESAKRTADRTKKAARANTKSKRRP